MVISRKVNGHFPELNGHFSGTKWSFSGQVNGHFSGAKWSFFRIGGPSGHFPRPPLLIGVSRGHVGDGVELELGIGVGVGSGLEMEW